MKQPEKWRETIDPLSINFKNFKLLQVLGYPHAGNDVFYANGIFNTKNINVFIKVQKHVDSNIKREIINLSKIDLSLKPTILEYSLVSPCYIITDEILGERLSYIVKDNIDNKSYEYMYEFGKNLALIHSIKGDFPNVIHRSFFDIPPIDFCIEHDFLDAFNFLVSNKPSLINECFVHGDFHYANILWNDNKQICGILDFELSGIGNREFDIAWSLIRRPGQTFMKTEIEENLYFNGYSSISLFNKELVIYYMIQIYLYFYKNGINDKEYCNYIKAWISSHIK
ncbi:MAG: aminoglycoside phosphotransferase family protein [Clostridium sp.]